jgi:hypothetical protein
MISIIEDEFEAGLKRAENYYMKLVSEPDDSGIIYFEEYIPDSMIIDDLEIDDGDDTDDGDDIIYI